MTAVAPCTLEELGAAQARLTEAIRSLLQPTTAPVGRDDVEPDACDLEARDRARSASLRAQHAAALARGDAAGMRRALARLIEHEQRAQDRAQALRATQGRLPSLLEQLQDAVQSTQGGGGASAGPHRAPIGLAAAELLAGIRRTVQGRPDQPLSGRVRSWAAMAGHWRTRDPQRLLWAAEDAEGWVAQGRAIVDPPRPLHLAAACPECGIRTVYVHDSGEDVRRLALQIDRSTGVAYCQACAAAWAPEHLPLLAAVLEQQAGER